ncbi:transposase [Candidatus Sumerlaeota bacterium]|nr:transposase [Candidatus Sumerlaeota bacterium]
MNPSFPPRRLADGGDRDAYMRSQWDVRIAARCDDQKGFVVQPVRWIVERTFAWLVKCRRLMADFEKTVSSATGMIYLAMISLMLRRLEPEG